MLQNKISPTCFTKMNSVQRDRKRSKQRKRRRRGSKERGVSVNRRKREKEAGERKRAALNTGITRREGNVTRLLR